jgi:hypothetical protein
VYVDEETGKEFDKDMQPLTKAYLLGEDLSQFFQPEEGEFQPEIYERYDNGLPRKIKVRNIHGKNFNYLCVCSERFKGWGSLIDHQQTCEAWLEYQNKGHDESKHA